MFNAIGRKITGDPCIGCKVRDEAYFPGRLYPGYSYVEGIEFSPSRHVATQVVETCDLALSGLDLSTRERFRACKDRNASPDAVVESVRLRLDQINGQIETEQRIALTNPVQ